MSTINHVTLSDLQRIEIQATTLFTHDGNGRILTDNEPDGAAASRFFLGRTTAGHICRFRHDVPEEVVQQLKLWVAREPIPQDLREPPLYIEMYQRILETHAPVQNISHGPAYHFPATITAPEGVTATRMTRDNAQALQPDFPWLFSQLDEMPPVFAVLHECGAVAACFSSRFPGVANEAGVNTLEGFRGRGYAAAVVAGWATAIRARGVMPLYGTTWSNLASQAVARKLGLVLYGDDLDMR